MSQENVVESVNTKQPVLVANVLLRIERVDHERGPDGKTPPPLFIVTGTNVDFAFDDERYRTAGGDPSKVAGLCVRHVLGMSPVKQGGDNVGLREQTQQDEAVGGEVQHQAEGQQDAVRDDSEVGLESTSGKPPASPSGPRHVPGVSVRSLKTHDQDHGGLSNR